jgi:hypothetical protein
MKPIYVVLAAIGALLLFLFLGYYNLYNKAINSGVGTIVSVVVEKHAAFRKSNGWIGINQT